MGTTLKSWQVYRAFLKTGDDKIIADDLGLSVAELHTAIEADSELAEAAKAAMADRLPACFESLTDESKAYWEVLSNHKAPTDAKQAALLAIANNGERERQKLVAFGLMQNHFDVQSACKALNVPLKQFHKWLQSDLEFAEMIAEVQEAKKHFVESQLFRLISLGSEKATMFAAERLMKDRYSAKIEHSGSIDHNHQHTQTLDLSNLPLEVRGQILDLLRSQADPDGLLTIDTPSIKRIS